jgi:hypothetical protein
MLVVEHEVVQRGREERRETRALDSAENGGRSDAEVCSNGSAVPRGSLHQPANPVQVRPETFSRASEELRHFCYNVLHYLSSPSESYCTLHAFGGGPSVENIP